MARTRKATDTLRELWRLQPPEKRTMNDVLIFYGWLERNRPELLNRRHGDPYQQLKVDLSGYITPEKGPPLPKRS